MALLSGGIAAVFASALQGIMLDGALYRATSTEAQNGDVTTTFSSPITVKGQRDAVTENMRQSPGYTERDARIIILSQGISPAPTTDDEVAMDGTRWRIASVEADAANSHWIMRGTPV